MNKVKKRMIISRAFWIVHFCIALILCVLIAFALYAPSFYGALSYLNPIGTWMFVYLIFVLVQFVYLDICDQKDIQEKESSVKIIDCPT
jgi:hypothetical protein